MGISRHVSWSALALVLVLAAGDARAQARDCFPDWQPDREPGRVAVALILDPTEGNIVEGHSLATHICRITPTLASFLDELERLDRAQEPIASLYIISHSVVGQGHLREEGVLVFAQGSPRNVGLTELARQVGQRLPGGMSGGVNRIAFRGCRIGSASRQSLNAFRSALGAVRATGTNCRTAVMTSGPMLIDNRPIRHPRDLRNNEEWAFFNGEFSAFVREVFVDGAGTNVSGCTVGKRGNESVHDAAGKLASIYFSNGGNLAAVWTNSCGLSSPNASTRCDLFDRPHSRCMIHLRADEGFCRLVEVRD